MSAMRIQILSRDSTARTVPINAPVITIGETQGNDIKLPGASVAPQHARLEFDGTNYKVVDLDSESGTYLDEVKLLPGVPQVWETGQTLRIGQYWLNLEGGAAAMASGQSPAGTMIEQDSVRASFDPDEPLMMQVETPHLSVAPGGSTTVSVVVINGGQVPEPCQFVIEGIPASWVSMARSTVQIVPETPQTVKLIIRPPRAAESRAGEYPLTIRVTSQNRGHSTTGEAQLTITPFTQFQSDLQPQRTQASQPSQVLIHNQGNAPQTFTVKWQDWAGELTFKPPQMELTVAPGETGQVRFRVQPQQRHWFGGKKEYSFTSQVDLPGSDPQKLEGEVSSKAILSIGSLLLALMFVCLCAAASAAAYTYFPEAKDAVVSLGSQVATTARTAIAWYRATATPTATNTPVPTFTPTQTQIPLPTDTPAPTSTVQPTSLPTASPLPPTPTLDLEATVTAQAADIATAEVAPTQTVIAEMTMTAEAEATSSIAATQTAEAQEAASLEVPEAPAAPPEPDFTGNPLGNDLWNKIPLVVDNGGNFTCASSDGLKNLLPNVVNNNFLLPINGDFVYKTDIGSCSIQGNVGFVYDNGNFLLARVEDFEVFCNGNKFLSFQEAMQLFSSGEITWNGHIGRENPRVPNCDRSAP